MSNKSTPVVTISFDLMDATQKEAYDMLKKTGRRSELVILALSELIDKYELYDVDTKDIKTFLDGYDFIKKKKEG